MDLCNYVQNLYETYLVATDTLKYDIIRSSESLTMFVGGIVLLLLQPTGWKEPIIYYAGSYISLFKSPLDSTRFIVYIGYNDMEESEEILEVHLNYL